MSSESWKQVPRRPRYQAEESGRLRTEVERADGTIVAAQLQDLSRMGFQLCLPAPLAIDEAIGLRLQVPDSGLSLNIHGTVRWQRSAAENVWLAGCAADQPVDWESLGELFLNQILSHDGP